jgi:hypothetical protein
MRAGKGAGTPGYDGRMEAGHARRRCFALGPKATRPKPGEKMSGPNFTAAGLKIKGGDHATGTETTR